MIASVLVEIDTQILVLISSLLIPVVHGVITKAAASDASKVFMTLVLTGVAGLVNTVLNDEGVITADLLVTWGTTFVTTITTHYGLYKPLNVTSSTGRLQAATGGRGVAPLGSEELPDSDEGGHLLPWT